jgi:drug/metabolite transporter (DMT)-like permease
VPDEVRRSGLPFMVASAFAFSVMSALVKEAEVGLPTAEIVCARAAITLVLSIVMVRRAGVWPSGTKNGALLLRGMLGFTALACYYWTLGRLPLAEATTVHHTAPIWTAILAWLVLRESLGGATAIALACGMGGVVLVARPGASGIDMDAAGLGVALCGAVSSAAAYVTVRRLAVTEHPLVIVAVFPLVAFPASLVWAVPQWVTPDAREWLLLAAVGVTTQIGQVCLTYGLSREPAAKAMAVGYLQVVFAVVIGAVVFSEMPRWTTIAGAALIIGGTAIAARRR